MKYQFQIGDTVRFMHDWQGKLATVERIDGEELVLWVIDTEYHHYVKARDVAIVERYRAPTPDAAWLLDAHIRALGAE